jgi:hypothetical protein
VVPEFAAGGRVPTSENILLLLWDRLSPRLAPGQLVRLRLYEGPVLFVDYTGDGAGANEL